MFPWTRAALILLSANLAPMRCAAQSTPCNAGSAQGKILIFVTPGGFEDYLEEISLLSTPADMPQVLAISERYGISFASQNPTVQRTADSASAGLLRVDRG